MSRHLDPHPIVGGLSQVPQQMAREAKPICTETARIGVFLAQASIAHETFDSDRDQ